VVAERRLATEQAIAEILAQAPSVLEAIPRILGVVCDIAGWEWGALWVVDQHEPMLRCSDTWSCGGDVREFNELTRQTTLKRGVGLPGRVWESKKPAWIEDVLVDSNFPRMGAAKRVGLHGALGFPVMRGGEVVAVIEFFSRQVRPPDRQMMVMMSVVGGQIGQFMSWRRAESLLSQSEARTAAVLEVALDCVVSMDHRGLVMEWNTAAERTFGYSREEAIGREMAELIIPPGLREMHRTGLARYLATGEARVIGRRLEITAVRASGEEFPVELSITRLPTDGPARFTGYLRDITDRKSAEGERARLLASERETREQAEAASQAKDDFLATVSHELRTPLNAILGWAQLLRMTSQGDPDLIQGLETIERNSRSMAQLVEDVLDVSRIVQGKLRLEITSCDLVAVIGSAIETVRHAASAKRIRLEWTPPAASAPFTGDSSRLGQVVWNLLSNAIKFNKPGGVVRVELRQQSETAQITVTDSGEGIGSDFLPHVFERFTQADASARKRHGGLGLGLAIVRHLVELHGGTVQAHSEGAGRGSSFVVTLPVRVPARVAVAPSKDRAAAPDAALLSGLHVLIVEDHRDSRELAEALLRNAGATVTAVGSASAALAEIDREMPDVLLSDIGLADMDGYELIRAIRTREGASGMRLPSIVVTAFARPEDREKAALAGYDMYVSKPLDADELIKAVADITGRNTA
jgi:PAS domain S-box-containing protein